MNIDIDIANATFGHIAATGAPAITDALSAAIASAPQEPEARERYLTRLTSTEAAGRLFLRAYARAAAIGEAAQPFIGKRYSVDFAEAANAADLLIASDVLMAMLLDRELAVSRRMKIMLGVIFPELFAHKRKGCEISASGEGPEMLAIAALRQNGVDAATSAALGAWHGEVLGQRPSAGPEEGILADVALLRNALFETYLDRELEIANPEVSKRALKLGIYAVAMGNALAGRAANRRRRALLS